MPEIRFPNFDDDAAIYTSILALLDEGIADLNKKAGNVFVPSKR